jgi:hypothetical protein
MWHAIGQTVSLVEKPYEIEGRKGVSHALTFVSDGHAPTTVNLSPDCVSALGADYHDLKQFGTWVRVIAEFPDRLSDRGTMRPIRALTVQLVEQPASAS